MRYLYRPNANEELRVQGRYVVRGSKGAVAAREDWERWRVGEGEAEIWRAEWGEEDSGRGLLAHALVTAEGVERLKVRVTGQETPAPTLSLIPEGHGVMVSLGGEFEEVALPPVYGIVTPFLSLAGLGLPFDAALEERVVAMTYLLRPEWQTGMWRHRPAKFGFFPLGLRQVEVQGRRLRGKGWQMEAPGLAARSLWFDRNGIVLYGELGEEPGERVELEVYRTFG